MLNTALLWLLLPLFLWLADTQQATSLLQRGLIALGKGQSAEARVLLEQASDADPKNAYVWSSLAEVYRRTKDPKKAATAAEEGAKLGGNDPLVCHALAMYYSESEQPGRAAPLEQKFAESPRADPGAMARAGSLYLAAGAIDQASALATRALQQQDSALNQTLMGRVLVAKGQKSEAVPYLKKGWEANPADQAAAFEYATALLQTEAFADAADTVTLTMKKTAADAQLELLLGVARYGQRRFEDAIVGFLEVTRLDPDVEQPYLFLGRLLEQAGTHMPEIVKVDTQWAERDGRNPKAQLELAKAMLQQDHAAASAEGLLRKAISLDAKDWESHYQLGVLLEGRRDFAGAAEELQKSVALDSKQSMPHYHLARVYDRLGKSAEAEGERNIHTQLTAPAK